MRVLLISPPFYRLMDFHSRYYPYAIALLATVLRQRGHQVAAYDADRSERPTRMDFLTMAGAFPQYLGSFKDGEHPAWREIRQTLAAFRPDLVGVSVYTTYAASSFFTAELAKDVLPDCKVVLGGPHADCRPEECLAVCPAADYLLTGECEQSLPMLVERLEKRAPVDDVPGLCARCDGAVVQVPPEKHAKLLDGFPIPDRSLLLRSEQYSAEDMGLMMSSRGCPYNCTYCASHTSRVTHRTVQRDLEELEAIARRYGTVQFTFKDDSFTVNRKRVAEFCQGILERKLKICWECNTRVNLIDEETLRLMKRAGCNFVKVGIETGSERILEQMNKRTTLDQARKAASLLRGAGIHWTGYFLIGTPDETEADITATVDFVKELQPNLALLGSYQPFPGTAMFDRALECGLVKADMAREEFFTDVPLDYYRADRSRKTKHISAQRFQELDRWATDACRAHNTRFGNVAKAALAKASVYRKDARALRDDLVKYWHFRR